MLRSDRSKKTLDILRMLQERGVPKNAVSPFPGEQESEDINSYDLGPSGDTTIAGGTLLVPEDQKKKKPPRKKSPTPQDLDDQDEAQDPEVVTGAY